jgi:NAD(P)-dependent dehydrogenase (short-subunit alcohol dehydrogenase family)
MEIRLDHKTAIITGGGSGIGAAISLTFAKAGAHVFLIDLEEGKAQQTLDQIKGKGGLATFVQADVSQQQQMIAAAKSVAEQAGQIDILINNAGVAHVGKLGNTAEADFDRIYQVNVKGVYNGMYAVVGQMEQQGGGVILNMASIASTIGLPDRFAYSMSKGAVLNMTYTVARDYIGSGIRCNAIAPARIHTPFVDGFIAQNYPGREREMFEHLSKTQPIGRMGTPEEVANLALYLCSEQASFITGTNFPIDGGFLKLNT